MTNQPPSPSTEQPEIPADVNQYIDSLEEALSSTENVDYGGGAWLDMYSIKAVTNPDGSVSKYLIKTNLTSHARTPAQALANLLVSVGEVTAKYPGMTPYNPLTPIASGPTQRAAAQPPAQHAPAGAPVLPPAPGGAQALPPAPGGTRAPAPAAAGPKRGVFVSTFFDVVPNADGTTELAFWGAGRKFADYKLKKTPDELAAMIAQATGMGWTPGHFEKANRYTMTLKINWVEGRPKPNGGNYQDIESISL